MDTIPPTVSTSETITQPHTEAHNATSGADPRGVSEEQIWEVLRTCYDPEIPVNIVDLGLVYDVVVQGSRVDVKMTLTAPGCHLGGQIAGDVQSKLLSLEAVEE